MAVKFRSSSTQMNTAGTNSNSITITKPSQVADGDVLVAITTGPVNTVTPPAGWTLLGVFTDTDHQSNIYKRIAATEGASYVFGFSTSDCCGVSMASFVGGHDVLLWDHRSTGATNPSVGRLLDAARDSVGYQVFSWRDNATATMAMSLGGEQFDVVSNNTGATVFRGMAGYYYGPDGLSDIVNIGDSIPANSITQSQAVTRGLHFSLLVGDKEQDAETWSSTNGDFDVELKLDINQVNSTGGLTSVFRGDETLKLSAATSSAGVNESLAYDGLATTWWFSGAATGWLQYDFGVGVTKTIRRYRLTNAPGGVDPMNWTLKGSNNGADFTIVDTRTNESFGLDEEVREFKLNGTPAAYRYYRLDITSNENSGAVANIRVAEFRVSTIDVWEDVTTYVNEEAKIRITRGLQGASGRSDYTRAYVEFNNTDGRFSLRNQDGAYFGALQRNTEMRISKAWGTKSLQLQGDVQLEGTDMAGDGVRCVLTDALSIVGDMDIRIDIEPDSWRDAQTLAGVAVGDTVSSPWTLKILDDGRLELERYDGTSVRTYTSTVAVTPATRQSIKVTVDVNNGASGSDVKFYTATSIGGSYTQLGATATVATTANTSYAGGALCVGHVGSQSTRGLHGLIYNFELRTGIDGTLVSDIDFTALANGAHTFTETSNDWVTVNNAVVSNRRWRFHGEVAEWPVTWDPTGTWITASATGAGVQKRMERGKTELSVMRRYHTKGIITAPGAFERYATPFAYWAMEDEAGAFRLASGVPAKPQMQIYGNPVFGEPDGDIFKESGQLIKLNSAKFAGRVAGSASGYADIRWIMYAPTAQTAGTHFIDAYGSGTVKRVVVEYNTTNTWIIRGFDEGDSGSIFWNSGTFAVTTTAEPMHCRLTLQQVGANVNVAFNAYDVFATSLGSTTDTFSNGTIGRVHQINVNDDDSVLATDLYIGHIAVYGADSPTFAGTELNAHHYETAGARLERLCEEERIEFRRIGAADDSAFLGFQNTGTAFSNMSSAIVSDDGYLVDPLDAFGIEYKSGRSAYNQPAHLTLSYSGFELSGEIRPAEDDSHLVNDFTASRGGAGSARYQKSEGPLSVDEPPDGVGPYEDQQSYDLAHEGQCVDLASWQVHKGTLDEERYPRIEVALENLRIAASSPQTERILMLDVGKRLDITNPPSHMPADPIRQIVVGYEEWFDKFQHNFKLNTIPERTYEVARYDADDRFEGHASTLYQDITSGATSISVSTSTGQGWSTTATDFDIVIDGERMTATAVADDTASDTSDTFDRADSTTNLGSTDGGVIQAWTQNSGTWGINTNRAYISAAASSIATVAGTADFEELSVTVPVWASGEAWLNFRFNATTDRIRFGGTVATDARCEIIEANAVTRTETADADGNAFVLAAGDKLTVRCHGSVIECLVNDKLALCFTSTANQTYTRIGMQTATTAPRFDNFTFNSDHSPQVFTVTRGVNGVTATHKSGAEVKLYKQPYRGL